MGARVFGRTPPHFQQLRASTSSPIRIVDTVIEINRMQRLAMVPKIEKPVAGDLAGQCVAVLGLAFKPETDDMRDAPSVDIVKALIERGATVVAYDPASIAEAKGMFPISSMQPMSMKRRTALTFWCL